MDTVQAPLCNGELMGLMEINSFIDYSFIHFSLFHMLAAPSDKEFSQCGERIVFIVN